MNSSTPKWDRHRFCNPWPLLKLWPGFGKENQGQRREVLCSRVSVAIAHETHSKRRSRGPHPPNLEGWGGCSFWGGDGCGWGGGSVVGKEVSDSKDVQVTSFSCACGATEAVGLVRSSPSDASLFPGIVALVRGLLQNFNCACGNCGSSCPSEPRVALFFVARAAACAELIR